MLIELATVGALAAFAHDHGATPFDSDFDRVGKARGVPPNLLRAIARVESGFKADAHSSTNDYGLMQVNGRTLDQLRVDPAVWLQPGANIDAAARYLIQLQHELGSRYNLLTWAMAYNVGPDLSPRDVAERYGQRVVWHWLLYDVGRLGR